MSERQYVNGARVAVVVVKRDITGIAEADNKFAPASRASHRPADIRHCFQQRELPVNFLACLPGRLAIPSKQVQAATRQTQSRTFRDDYVWHSGGSASASVPHVFSQALASSLVRCRPVC